MAKKTKNQFLKVLVWPKNQKINFLKVLVWPKSQIHHQGYGFLWRFSNK